MIISFLYCPQAIPHVVSLKGQHSNRFVMLQPNLLGKIESMMQSADDRAAYLLSGDAGPQIITRQPGESPFLPHRTLGLFGAGSYGGNY